MERYLERLPWKRIRELVPDKIDIVLLPVGTVEAHGASAVGTDNIIPVSIAENIAPNINALIAPVLGYGITKSLYGYPGSITIRPENYEPFVTDILKSLKDIGFKKIIILNGHGGNDTALKNTIREFFFRYGLKIAMIDWWDICGQLVKEFYGQAGGHGGIDETAMVQAADERLVDKSLFDDDTPYLYQHGAAVYPVPGTTILYTENEGLPDFDAEKARQYQKKVFTTVEEFIKFILGRWDKI